MSLTSLTNNPGNVEAGSKAAGKKRRKKHRQQQFCDQDFYTLIQQIKHILVHLFSAQLQFSTSSFTSFKDCLIQMKGIDTIKPFIIAVMQAIEYLYFEMLGHETFQTYRAVCRTATCTEKDLKAALRTIQRYCKHIRQCRKDYDEMIAQISSLFPNRLSGELERFPLATFGIFIQEEEQTRPLLQHAIVLYQHREAKKDNLIRDFLMDLAQFQLDFVQVQQKFKIVKLQSSHLVKQAMQSRQEESVVIEWELEQEWVESLWDDLPRLRTLYSLT